MVDNEDLNKSCFIGYGIDCHGKFRDLPHLCLINSIGLKYAQDDKGLPITPVKKPISKPATEIQKTPSYQVTKNLLTISAFTESSMQYSGEKSDQIDVDMGMNQAMVVDKEKPAAATYSPRSFSV